MLTAAPFPPPPPTTVATLQPPRLTPRHRQPHLTFFAATGEHLSTDCNTALQHDCAAPSYRFAGVDYWVVPGPHGDKARCHVDIDLLDVGDDGLAGADVLSSSSWDGDNSHTQQEDNSMSGSVDTLLASDGTFDAGGTDDGAFDGAIPTGL